MRYAWSGRHTRFGGRSPLISRSVDRVGHDLQLAIPRCEAGELDLADTTKTDSESTESDLGDESSSQPRGIRN